MPENGGKSMDKDNLEKMTLMDMKGLVFNDEMSQSMRVLVNSWLTMYDEAKKQGRSEETAVIAASETLAAMMKGNQK
jgi:hypothetical protein